MAPEAEVQGRDLPALARAMCDRQEGIGADGLMIYAFERRRRAHAAVQRRWKPVGGVGQRRPMPGSARASVSARARQTSPSTLPRVRNSFAAGQSAGMPSRFARRWGPAGHPQRRARGRGRERAGGGVARRQSAVRAARRPAARIAASHAGPGDRTSSEVSRSHERVVRAGGGAQPRAHLDLGERRWRRRRRPVPARAAPPLRPPRTAARPGTSK